MLKSHQYLQIMYTIKIICLSYHLLAVMLLQLLLLLAHSTPRHDAHCQVLKRSKNRISKILQPDCDKIYLDFDVIFAIAFLILNPTSNVSSEMYLCGFRMHRQTPARVCSYVPQTCE